MAVDCCIQPGNPIDAGTGAKIQRETDIAPIEPSGLQFRRTYNSQARPPEVGTTSPAPPKLAIFGPRWQHNYQKQLLTDTINNNSTVRIAHIARGNGEYLTFYLNLNTGIWQTRAYRNETLTKIIKAGVFAGWQLMDENDTAEIYDTAGKLVRITQRSGLSQYLDYSDGTAAGAYGAVSVDTQMALPAGLLLRVMDDFGRSLSFAYRSTTHLAAVTNPAGDTLHYGYTQDGRLQSVAYPDAAVRQYVYYADENLPPMGFSDDLLTGVIDELGTRFATFSYDSLRRAVSTEHANGVEKYSVSYPWTTKISGNTVAMSITSPLSTTTTAAMTLVGSNVYRADAKTIPCSTPGCVGTVSDALTYWFTGHIASRTDFNNNRTNYAYDLSRNLETLRTEGLTAGGANTAVTRTTTTTWDPVYRLPEMVTEPVAGGKRITTHTYDASGNLVQRQVTAPVNGVNVTRTWNWSHDPYGRVLTATDPLGRTTTYSYYPNTAAQNLVLPNSRGLLATITNAAGHTTTLDAYNALGQVIKTTDPNGLITSLSYDARQRLTSRSVGSETTTYQYDAAGQLIQLTLPDGSSLHYGYDAAHRLIQIQDGLGNKILYTLDAMGNRLKEDALDPQNVLARTRSKVYDSLNRLQKDIGGVNQTSQYSYDNNGNLTGSTDPLNRVTAQLYDPLNRLMQVNDPVNGAGAPTKYQYDAQDNLTQVIDPKGLATGYVYNGFNELMSQTSPDTGTTSFTYDAAGNLLTKSDARGVTATYGYDNLNRVTGIQYPATMGATGSSPAQTVSYGYDACANGKGRLCTVIDRTGTTSYSYDLHGRVTAKSQTVNGLTRTIGYRYNAAGQLDEISYPSGRKLAIGYQNNRVANLNLDGQPLVKTVDYEPFGPVGEWTWGNDTPAAPNKHTRYFDLDGRNARIDGGAGVAPNVVVYDAASRVTALQKLTANNQPDPANSAAYGYDNLDRLTSQTPGAGNPAAKQNYSYDAVGNRTSQTTNGAVTSYSYSATSHRLNALTGATSSVYTHDAVGNRLSDGVRNWIYGGDNRVNTVVIGGGATVLQAGVNALGQRVLKTVNGGSQASVTHYVYDESGKLIGEYRGDGTPIREHLWLNDLPVGVVQ